ncbi:MAG: peptidylprolyl isomerase [Thaumarchaeota archaeon]|nr:peptidylprolyl isomerase [Nitrososphaerota archaeon]MBT4510503.1 peptidylprolyl isomerase [Nitrososphaerota archaeon]MBT4973512.1 peptidylprolyl isomerase [Nitrososphaerota archaeon]MBT5238058.1 peptidylprolyl isomerase [Nitrososphaerota archaeon]MBT5993116.1 peptidylprolyl isomerase [Nitrososphaerota archaeon]
MNGKFFSIIFTLLIFAITPQAFAEYEDTLVVLETESGRLIIEFFPQFAPNHVENFVTLSEDGFYTGTIFHRIIPGFMIQGGDPKSADPSASMSEWGTGDPGYSIDAEFNNIEHKRGIVSMARSSDPNSAGSQFFIVHSDSNFLDGQYTVFGRILTDESFETLDRIANSNTAPNDQPMDAWKAIIKNVDVMDRSELSNLPEYVTPVTTAEGNALIAPTTSQPNSFPEYGFSFTSPAGWLVQTPTPSGNSPDIVAVGPKTSTSAPAVSFTITREDITIEEAINGLRQQVTPMIETGALTIVSEEGTQVKGNNAYLLKAIGHFENREGIEMNIGFATFLIKVDDMFYTVQYTNNLESFDRQSNNFDEIVSTIEFTNIDFAKIPVGSDSEKDGYVGTMENENEEGGGCLIATAAFGSEMEPQVQFLREIRDGTVMSTQSGTVFMTGFNQFYYSFSPYVADYERENPVFKEAVKVTLTPLLTSLTLLNYVEVDTEEEMLGYGIGIILLNIGMYFVAPAAVIIAIKNRIKQQ